MHDGNRFGQPVAIAQTIRARGQNEEPWGRKTPLDTAGAAGGVTNRPAVEGNARAVGRDELDPFPFATGGAHDDFVDRNATPPSLSRENQKQEHTQRAPHEYSFRT